MLAMFFSGGEASFRGRRNSPLPRTNRNNVSECEAFNVHSEPFFFHLQISLFEDLTRHHKLMFMHAIDHSYSALTFPQFTFNSQANMHRFNLRNDFFIPGTNISTVQKVPIVDFPNTWNNLDQ